MEDDPAEMRPQNGNPTLTDPQSLSQPRDHGCETHLKYKSSLRSTQQKPASLAVALQALLLMFYFWGSSFVLALTQYCGILLYYLDRDYYYRYMAFTKEGMGLLVISITQWFSPTTVRVSGDKSVEGQIRMTSDGRIEFNFPERLVLIANHQLYSDWLYLWWAAYTNRRKCVGNIFIVLKEALRYIPVVGPGLMFAGFIFMSRKLESDKPRLAHRTSQLRRHTPQGFVPMWLMMFPEGTNLGKNGRRNSSRWAEKQGRTDLRHQLIPRSTGTYLCLKALDGTVDYVYDCTLAYDGIPDGEYGQDVFPLSSMYFKGVSPVVHMHWRCFKTSEIPLRTQEEFNEWMQEQWLVKDEILERFSMTGRFPASSHYTTQIKLDHWREVWRIFVVPVIIVILVFAFRMFSRAGA